MPATGSDFGALGVLPGLPLLPVLPVEAGEEHARVRGATAPAFARVLEEGLLATLATLATLALPVEEALEALLVEEALQVLQKALVEVPVGPLHGLPTTVTCHGAPTSRTSGTPHGCPTWAWAAWVQGSGLGSGFRVQGLAFRV